MKTIELASVQEAEDGLRLYQRYATPSPSPGRSPRMLPWSSSPKPSPVPRDPSQRMPVKAEYPAQGENTRLVVTNRWGGSASLV